MKDFIRKSFKNTLSDIICGVAAIVSVVTLVGSFVFAFWALLSGLDLLVGLDGAENTILSNNSIAITLVCVVSAFIVIFCHNCIEIFRKQIKLKLDKWIKTSEDLTVEAE